MKITGLSNLVADPLPKQDDSLQVVMSLSRMGTHMVQNPEFPAAMRWGSHKELRPPAFGSSLPPGNGA